MAIQSEDSAPIQSRDRAQKYRWNNTKTAWEFNEPAWGGWMILRRGPHDSNPAMSFSEGVAYFKERGIPWENLPGLEDIDDSHCTTGPSDMPLLPPDISDRDPVSRLDDETERRFYDVVACVLAGEVEISDVRPESICEEFFPFQAERVNASLNALRQRIRELQQQAAAAGFPIIMDYDDD